MQRLFFENPAPLIVGLIAVGLVGAAIVRTTHPRRSLGFLAGAAVAACGAWILARTISTAREEVKSASTRLVAAVRDADTTAIDDLLADQALFIADAAREGVGAVVPSRLDKAQILANVREHLDGDARVSHARIKESTTRIAGPGVAQLDARVQVIFERYGPHESWWRLDWRRTDAGVWRCWVVEPLGEPRGDR